MRGYGIVSLAISGTLVMAYQVIQPAPELGVTPEMFSWGPGWVGWAVGFVVSTLILALIIAMAVQLVRWLKGLRDLT
jgi:fructose-specific phosphotransferase system IIC component